MVWGALYISFQHGNKPWILIEFGIFEGTEPSIQQIKNAVI